MGTFARQKETDASVREESTQSRIKGGAMTCTADVQVSIQTFAQSVPSTPDWFGEVVLISHHIKRSRVAQRDVVQL
jgi:hypothetical protein